MGTQQRIGPRIQIRPTIEATTAERLAQVYTPGVADAVGEIAERPAAAAELTTRGGAVAVISDGSAVLGLGDVGALAALPVLEGKSALLKQFAELDAWPLCLDTRDVAAAVDTVARIAPGFAAINLEDIAAPRCFDVQRGLADALDIPVFHDDQHGTAIVVLAGLRNALRVVGRELARSRVVISGAGAAGSAVTRLLDHLGVEDIVVCDSHGALHPDRDDLDGEKRWLAEHTNAGKVTGDLSDALADASVFIGVSAPDILEPDDIARMAPDPIVFALANPRPEVDADAARERAAVLATGRSDQPNQVNNLLAFPGVLRGLVTAGATRVTMAVQDAAASAIAAAVGDAELAADRIVPSVFSAGLADRVAAAVRQSV